MVINPYLTFLGNCEEAFHFYKSVFGGDFTYVGRFNEMPPQGGAPLNAEDGEKIMHISLPIGKVTTLMGSDAGGDWAPNISIGNNITISITADSKADADKIFIELAKGGKITMPLADTFWGDYFGMCTDKFSINWMMSYNAKAQQY
jgi:PhnB protein